jgi:hypothetical protein
MERFLYYSLCLPEDLTLWTAPLPSVRRWDDRALVYDVIVGPDAILRHYSFYDRWFEVNCSMDGQGRFITEPGPIDWTFNIDVSAPFFSLGNSGFNVDLCLDVLVAGDGERYVVTDEDDFETAIASGWITEEERIGALSGLEEVREIIERGRLLPFLEEVCPFEIRAVPQPPPEKPRLSAFPPLDRAVRGGHFGRKAP